MRKYSILGCVGRGLVLNLRVCPSWSPPASGNLEFPFGIEVEKQGFRTAWNITGQKFQGVGLILEAFILTFPDLASHCQKIMRVAGQGDLECESFFPDLGFF